MKSTLIDISRTKTNKSKSVSSRPSKSKDADHSILKLGVFIDIFSFHMKTKKMIYSDYDSIVYLPLPYIEMLHNFIIRLYSKSDDPVISGYMSRDNLDYTMDHVKYMYSKTKSKKEKIIKKAAFMMYNVASKHPFTDGNKRTAIISCNSFLEYNGYTICVLPYRQSKKFITEVAIGSKKERDCQKFISKHISRLFISKRTRQEIKKLHRKIELEKDKLIKK